MAKQTNPKTEASTEATAINAVEVEVVETSIVPAKKAGELPVLFTGDNKERLIKAFVSSEVVNFDQNAETCAALAKKHSKLKVKDKDDVKGYEAVKAAYNELVKVRTSTDKKRKELGEPYSTIKKGIDDYARDNITGVLASEEARLKVEKEKYEKWAEEEQKRKEAEAEALLKKRVAELKEAGLMFNGELYVIGENISVDVVTIGKMKDTDYAFFLEKVRDEKRKIDEAAAAEAAAKAEEQRKADEQKAENERKAKELRDERLELRREKLEAIGFTDDPEKERFYFVVTGCFFELTYDLAADYNAADFKVYVEKMAKEIQDAKTAAEMPQTPHGNEPEAPAEPQAETEASAEPASTSTTQDDDLGSLIIYIADMQCLPIPKLISEEANNILSVFKNEVKRAADKAINDINVIKNG